MTFSLPGDTTVSVDKLFWTSNKPVQQTLYAVDGASPSHKFGLLLYEYCSCEKGEKYEDGKIRPVYVFTLD
jgi:hypothetical protein